MRPTSIVVMFAAPGLAAPFAEPQVLTLTTALATDSLAVTVAASVVASGSISTAIIVPTIPLTTTLPASIVVSSSTSTAIVVASSSPVVTVAASAVVSASISTSTPLVQLSLPTTSILPLSSTTSSKTTSTSSKRTTSSTSTKKSTSTTSKKTTSSTSNKPTAPSTPTSTVVAATVSASVAGTPVAQSRTGTLPAGAIPTTLPQIALYHHNIHRANHSAPDLVWSDNLALIASNIASSCIYAHNVAAGGGGYGQNIAAGVMANNISRVITDLFYNGEVNLYVGLYGQPTPNFTNFVHWGHFSQVVWKQTTSVGCAVQYCPGGLANTGSNIAPYFTVCNYGPPGNYIGEFGDNVGVPLGMPTAEWNTGLGVSI